jgi:SAM-dependent methyltransferase
MNKFSNYEGKLALSPIIRFIVENSPRCRGKLVDIGCGSKPYSKYFEFINEYIGVDRDNVNADINADAKSLPIDSSTVDVVLCNQVIEHDPEPDKIILEISRVLKNNGILILSAPQMARLHGEPKDYYRFTKWGLKYLLEKNGFIIDRIESHGGIFRALGSHINFFLIETSPPLCRGILRRSVILSINLVCGLLDNLIKWNKDTLGYNVIAVKGR